MRSGAEIGGEAHHPALAALRTAPLLLEALMVAGKPALPAGLLLLGAPIVMTIGVISATRQVQQPMTL